jgi:hypothetical protein
MKFIGWIVWALAAMAIAAMYFVPGFSKLLFASAWGAGNSREVTAKTVEALTKKLDADKKAAG